MGLFCQNLIGSNELFLDHTKIQEKFDIGDFLCKFLTEGYYAFDGSSVLSGFDLEAFMPIQKEEHSYKDVSEEARFEKYSEKQVNLLIELKRNIRDKYLSELPHQAYFQDMWSAITAPMLPWHNDLDPKYFSSDINATMNLYFDGSDSSTGGLLQFHPYVADGDIDPNSELIRLLYPPRYSIVLFNQSPEFVHRVSYATHVRRIFNFALNIELLPKVMK